MLRQPNKVPQYQRNYSWRRQEWEEFWQDLFAFYKQEFTEDKNAFYFLGTIVVTTDGGDTRVLDGQQRLATMLILLRALVTAATEVDPSFASEIRQHFGRHRAPGDGFDPPLTMSAYDSSFFEKRIVLGDPDVKPTIPSHKLIEKALTFFTGELAQERAKIDDADKFVQWLDRFATAAVDNVTVVLVELDKEDSAGQLFESLNDRGIGLSTLDLFRNFVLQHTSDPQRRNEVQQDWWRLHRLQTGGRPEELLRFYWITREGDVKARSLFRDIKRKLAHDPDGPYEVAEELLAGFVDYYEQLLRAEHKDPEAPAMA